MLLEVFIQWSFYCVFRRNSKMKAGEILGCLLLMQVLLECFRTAESNEGVIEQVIRLRDRRKNDCNETIVTQYGWMNTPNYPASYPRYSRCTYIVERLSKDVCELKLTITQFQVTKMPFGECSEDYLELQDSDRRFRICGYLPEGSTKFVFFPSNSNKMIFKFHSTFHQNKGFSIQVKQLAHSCYKDRIPMTERPTTEERIKNLPTSTPMPPVVQPPVTNCNHVLTQRVDHITSPGYPAQYKAGDKCVYTIQRSEPRACLVQLDFVSFELVASQGCTMDYLLLPDENKLCGVLGGNRRFLQFSKHANEMRLEFSASSNGGKGFDIQMTQLPGPCDYEPAMNLTVPVSQCDQVIRETSGVITSPNYPGHFGPNFKCTYSIYRPDSSVCQLELEVDFFDLGKHNPASCSTGPFLELPGKNRVCHELTGKVLLKVSEFQDPVRIYFKSDSHSSGSGFKIHITQVPRSCSGSEEQPGIPNATKRCYQEVSVHRGYFTRIAHITPSGSQMNVWCEFVIYRADPTVCIVDLQISARRELGVPCTNNFVQLPNGERMCISTAEHRQVAFKRESDFISLISYNRDNPEYHLVVQQQINSCYNRRPQVQPEESKWSWSSYNTDI